MWGKQGSAIETTLAGFTRKKYWGVRPILFFDHRRCAILLLVALPELLAAEQKPAQRQFSAPILVEPGPREKSTFYSNGAEHEVQTETVWRPMCGSDTSNVTVDELRRIAQLSKEAAAAHPWIGAAQGGVVSGQGGLDLVFNVTSALPAGASEALLAVEQYIESQFSDPVTVVINIGFASLGPGILGSTGSSYTNTSWPNARAGLQADMDPDDSIQSFLPAGSTIPVRYNGNTADVTNENRVYFTLANYRAAIGTVSGTAASMTFSSNFSWDYTPPSINPGAYCFQSVITHEVGHALGFTSGADFRFSDIEALDIYRFQRSDGSGDYNPDTLAEFTTTARMVDQNAPGTDNDVNSDLITVEYQMSDGVPNQASHFAARNPGIYIMDPSLSSGETFYPDFFRSGDSDMFDAIGWDYPPTYTSCEPVNPPQAGPGTDLKNRFISLQGSNPGKLTALRVKLTSLQHPDPPNEPSRPPTDFSAFEGEYRWVGPPVEYREGLDPQPTFIAAQLQCAPYFTDWSTVGLVNVYGAEIIPSSLYHVQAIEQDCDISGGESNYSAALPLGTSRWGDVDPPFNPPSTQSQPDVIDIVGLVNKLKDLTGAPTKVYALLQPAILDPSGEINAFDIVSGVDALKGFAYPYTGIVACPP